MLVEVSSRTVPNHSPLARAAKRRGAVDLDTSSGPSFQATETTDGSNPVLAYYSQQSPTIVSADASSHGIGAVLLQVQDDGRQAPIMYASRALTITEQRYSQIEKEALAMAWACEKFHCYLFGMEMPFVVETDHKPLLAIMNTQSLVECPPRLMRLNLRMLRYCFTVEYMPSKKLVVADALSRAPIVTDESQQETTLSVARRTYLRNHGATPCV